jgi:acyl-coenzyme A thioesterase PaaI-like protein
VPDGGAASGDDSGLGLDLRYELTEREGGGALLVAAFTPKPRHRGAPGFLHGGMAATVLDETMAAVGYALDKVHTVTGTLNVRYRRPVPLASKLRVEAWRDRPEIRRHQRVRGRILLEDGTVAVEAEGIFVQAVLR